MARFSAEKGDDHLIDLARFLASHRGYGFGRTLARISVRERASERKTRFLPIYGCLPEKCSPLAFFVFLSSYATLFNVAADEFSIYQIHNAASGESSATCRSCWPAGRHCQRCVHACTYTRTLRAYTRALYGRESRPSYRRALVLSIDYLRVFSSVSCDRSR